MTTTMTATQMKAQILAVLDRVVTGEEFEITKHGRVVARLVAANSPGALRGSCAGTASSSAPDDDLFSTGELWQTS